MVGACRWSQDGEVCCHQLSPGQSCLTCRNRIKPFPKWPPRWFSTVYHNSCKEMRQFNGQTSLLWHASQMSVRTRRANCTGRKRRKETELDLVSVATDCQIIKNANPGHNKYFLPDCFCSLKHRNNDKNWHSQLHAPWINSRDSPNSRQRMRRCGSLKVLAGGQDDSSPWSPTLHCPASGDTTCLKH